MELKKNFLLSIFTVVLRNHRSPVLSVERWQNGRYGIYDSILPNANIFIPNACLTSPAAYGNGTRSARGSFYNIRFSTNFEKVSTLTIPTSRHGLTAELSREKLLEKIQSLESELSDSRAGRDSEAPNRGPYSQIVQGFPIAAFVIYTSHKVI